MRLPMSPVLTDWFYTKKSKHLYLYDKFSFIAWSKAPTKETVRWGCYPHWHWPFREKPQRSLAQAFLCCKTGHEAVENVYISRCREGIPNCKCSKEMLLWESWPGVKRKPVWSLVRLRESLRRPWSTYQFTSQFLF